MNIYKNLLQKFPLPTRMATAGTVLATADVCYQFTVEKKSYQQLNYNRIKTNAFIGTFIMAPYLGLWFKKIHPYILKKTKCPKRRNSGKYRGISMAADSLIFFPTAQLLYHFSYEQIYNKGIQGKKTPNWIQTQKYQHSINNYLKIWLPVCLFYYCCVPIIFRPLCANLSITSWNQYVNVATKI